MYTYREGENKKLIFRYFHKPEISVCNALQGIKNHLALPALVHSLHSSHFFLSFNFSFLSIFAFQFLVFMPGNRIDFWPPPPTPLPVIYVVKMSMCVCFRVCVLCVVCSLQLTVSASYGGLRIEELCDHLCSLTTPPLLPSPWQLPYAWVMRGINIFSWQYFPQHDMINLLIFLLSSDVLFSLSFVSWFINICHGGPKARRALNAPPSWQYLLSPWRDWYSVCICMCVCLRGLCTDRLGAFSILFSAFSRFCDNFPQGKNSFSFLFRFLQRAAATCVYKMI